MVCGHITYESVSHFLKDFLHEDREDVDVEGGGRLEVTQTEIGHYKSDCLASDVGPLASAKV